MPAGVIGPGDQVPRGGRRGERRGGNRYLKTVADGDAPNNLLALPECS